MPALLTIPARTWVVTPVVMMLTLMTITYTLYYKHGGSGLPTISNTFVDPPGNYFSRIGVGASAAFLYICMLIVSYVSVSPSRNSESTLSPFPLSNKMVAATGLFGVFCLSWVGAICDSSKPSCGGNNAIHTTFAIIFFVLLDFVAIYITCVSPRRPPALCCVALLLSIASKARFAPLFGAPSVTEILGMPYADGAVFELTDVFSVMAWMCWYLLPIPQTKAMSVGIMRDDPILSPQHDLVLTEDTRRHELGARIVHARVSATTWSSATASLVALVPVACVVVAELTGHKPPPGQLPFISDCMDFIPTNWISRWGLVFGGMMGLVHVVVTAQLTGLLAHSPHSDYGGRQMQWITRLASSASTLCGIAGVLALAAVGCVNKAEDAELHSFSGTVLALASNIYVLAQLLLSLRSRRDTGCALLVLAAACTLCKLRWLQPMFAEALNHDDVDAFRVIKFLPLQMHSGAVQVVALFSSVATSAALQWADSAVVLLFALTFVRKHSGAMPGLSVAIWSSTDEACGDGADDQVAYEMVPVGDHQNSIFSDAGGAVSLHGPAIVYATGADESDAQ
eukprot:g2621.t1